VTARKKRDKATAKLSESHFLDDNCFHLGEPRPLEGVSTRKYKTKLRPIEFIKQRAIFSVQSEAIQSQQMFFVEKRRGAF